MPEFDPDKFECYMHPVSGQFHVSYDGIPAPHWGGSGGSREFFVIGKDKFFVKCAYGEYGSQCKTETYQYAKIEPWDRRYFTELVYSCDFKSRAHWTVWRYVDLKPKGFYDQEVWDRCNRKVHTLCTKYEIADVRCCFNHNWFVVNNQPLIVDIGCD